MGAVPFIEVKIYDRRLDEQSERELIERLTQATVDVFGEDIRDQTWIALSAIPPRRWGQGGVPGH
ncbi:tautomerase family protein [Streptomyces sp. NPDC006283]|uniref:tautomerase family protein n=1 Tax=Streptomyces sp. NPDC006283 TaxID=3156741 RepID=UPI0033BBAEC5